MSELSLPQERELLLQIGLGDQAAFKSLFEKYHHSLGEYVFSITKSEQVAEEIVQDSFLKIWMSRETLTEIRSFKAYLFIIARNAAISAFRKSVRDFKKEQEWLKNNLLTDDSEERKQKEKYLSVIDYAIEALHPQRKKVYIMTRKQGLSYEQVALVLGISKSTVKSHLQQATTAITQYVKQHESLIPGLFFIFFYLF